jgi:hypothetical protein
MRKIIARTCNSRPSATLFFSGGNMKLTAILAALAASAASAILTGCESPTPTLISLEPVATAADTAIDSALLGTWEQAGDNVIAIIRAADQGGYQIAVLSGSSVLGFQARLLRVDDAELLDLSPADDNDFRIPGHAILRLWVDGSALRWAFLDTGWLKQQAAVLIGHTGDGKMQIFSPSAAIRAFITAYGASDKAYGKVAMWQKAQ